MKPLKKILFIAVILIFLSGCGLEKIPPNEPKKEENKKIVSGAKDILNSIQNMPSSQNTKKYEDKTSGFRFQYPIQWEMDGDSEKSGNFILLNPELVNGVSYSDYMSFQVSSDSFEEIKKKIEDRDRMENGASLNAFIEVKNIQMEGISVITGTHSTAIGLDEIFYYFPLKTKKGGLYVEFRDRTPRVEALLKTVQIF